MEQTLSAAEQKTDTTAKAVVLEKWIKQHQDSLSLWEVERINTTLKNYNIDKSENSFFVDLEVGVSLLHQYSKKVFDSTEKTEISTTLQNFRRDTRSCEPVEKKQSATQALLNKYSEVLDKLHLQQQAEEKAQSAKIHTTNATTIVKVGTIDIKKIPKLFAQARLKFKTFAEKTQKRFEKELLEEFNESNKVKEFLSLLIKSWIENQASESLHTFRLNTKKYVPIRKRNSKHGYKTHIYIRDNKLTFFIAYNHFLDGRAYFGGQEAAQVIEELWQLYVYFNGEFPFELGRVVDEDESEQEETSTVTEDLAYFHSLPEVTVKIWGQTNHYLQRKGFFPTPQLLTLIKDCVRISGNIILLLVSDIDGNERGVQFVNCNGVKWFSSGLDKKGAFIVLGEINSKKTRFITCEGFATGLSIKLALPEHIVSCALDAGNLERVTRALRVTYGSKSKCEIIIAADDDYWKSLEIDPKTGKAKPNTGLTKAHPVALRHRCKIVSPNFTAVDTSIMPTDFNDLMIHAGLEEVRKQLLQAKRPKLHLAISQESIQQERIRTYKQFYNHNLISINERYLSEELPSMEEGNVRPMKDFIFGHKVSLLRCPIGTGKTTAIAKVLEGLENCSVLYISYLKTINQDGAARLKLENYQDYQCRNNGEYAKITELQKLSICLNSLFKLLNKEGKLRRKIDVVIIDEIQQVIRRLTSNVKYKVRVLSALKQLVQSAKHLVLMDAHIDNLTLDLLKLWLGEEKYFVLLNEYQVGKGRNITLYDHEAMVIDKLIDAVNSGQNSFLVTNCKRQAEDYLTIIKQRTSQNKVHLYISGDSGGELSVKQMFENVNEEVTKYHCIVCTPSVTSGISIDVGHFDFVGGIFTHTVNTPMDALQALGRVRKANNFHVYVSDVKQVLPTKDEEIAAKWTHSHPYDRELLPLEYIDDEELIDVARDYKKICISATKEANFAMQDFLMRFIKLCIIDGYNIAYWDGTLEELAQAKTLRTDAKKQGNIEFVKGCSKSATISDEKRNELKNKSSRTIQETLSLTKAEIIDFYKVDKDAPQEALEQVIIDDRRGKTREEISNLELALASKSQIQEMREEELKQGIELLPDKRAFATECWAYQYLLMFAGINKELISNNNIYSADILLQTFIPWVFQHYPILKGVFNRLPSAQAIGRDPVRVFGSMLKRVGLRQIRVGRSENAHYTIKLDDLEKRRNIIVKRGKISIKSFEGTHDAYRTIITRSVLDIPNIPNGG